MVEVIRRAILNGAVINYVTLMEVAHYLRRLPKEEFTRRMKLIQDLSSLSVVDLDDHITRLALDMLPDHAAKGLGGRDCVILATMQASGVKSIATHDHAFRNIKDIQVIDTIPPQA